MSYHGEWRAALYTAMRRGRAGDMLDRPAGERFRAKYAVANVF